MIVNLSKSARALQLLILHPLKASLREIPLECSIYADTLDNKPVYSVLAYAGFDHDHYLLPPDERAQDTIYIQVHGRAFTIHQNLAFALRWLRIDKSARIL